MNTASRFSGPDCFSAGTMLMPSIFCSGFGFSFSASRIVGYMSTAATTASLVVPGFTTPGHATISGTRTPPS